MYCVWAFQNVTPKVHLGGSICGTGCVSLWLCICEITVSTDLVMGSGYFQVFVYKLVCVSGYPVSMNWGLCLSLTA